jgi:hypothetical protein
MTDLNLSYVFPARRVLVKWDRANAGSEHFDKLVNREVRIANNGA